MNEPAIFRLLLALYPPRFRRAYGDDVLAATERRRQELYATGPRPLRLAAVLARDLAFSLPRAWWTHGLGRHGHLIRLPEEESSLMNTLGSDLRYAVRRLVRTPGTALIAIVAIGLGIGLTTAMFSIVNGVVLRGLPFDDPHELTALMRINPSEGPSRLLGRIHDYRDIVERQTTFDGIAAINAQPFNVSPPGADPELVQGAYVTANMFELLGEQPVLGRVFTDDEEILGGPAVAVVGNRFWRERLGADPDVVGTTARINGTQTTVLGVMPEGFEFPIIQQIWQPLRVAYGEIERSEGPPLIFVGRLADGVSVQQGQADIDRIMAQLALEHPDTNAGMTMISRPYVREIIGYQIPQLLFTMLGAVAMVLLIACANVANLLLARASQRTREVAISSALGASRRRVFFQLLSEAGIIGVLGSVVGIGVAKLGIDQFNFVMASLPTGAPFWFAIELDARVLGFVVMLTVAASLLSGVIPAAKASGANANDVLKDSSRGGTSLRIGRLSRGLVLAEVAVSCALLVAAGLMIRSVTNYLTQEYAFDETGLFTAGFVLPVDKYPDAESRRQFFRELTPRLEALPGVTDVTLASDPPVLGFTNGRVAIGGNVYQGDRDYPSTRIGMVDERYFSTLRAPLAAGRDFAADDNADAPPVMIVNQAFAQTHFPDKPAIGERVAIRATSQTGTSDRNDDLYYTIVGVAPDLFLESQLFILSTDAIYVPLAQRPTTSVFVLARTASGDPLELSRPVKDAIGAIDADLPLTQPQTMATALAQSSAMLSTFAAMFVIFGGAALFLATIGLYGVLSFSVSQRRFEVGLRMALGATQSDVRRLVLGQGFKQLLIGMAIGLVMAFGLGRMMSVVLYRVSAADPVVMVGIVVVLLVTGLTACYIPARRATKVDPLEAMRSD